MKDIIEKAEQLGRLIAASERFETIDAARKAADGDAELQDTMKVMRELGGKIAALEKEVKPIGPEDKRRLRDLQEKVTGHPKLQQLARAEADFAELMNRVNRAIRAELKA